MAAKKQGISTAGESQLAAVVKTAFAQIAELGNGTGVAPLFPDGMGSLELELDAGNGMRFSLRLKANHANGIAGVVPDANDVRIFLEGDVEATFNARGHRVIALIAQHDLTQRFPNTMKKVQKILDDGGRDLLSAATFPDDIRNSQPETKPFHFVDIELEAGGPLNPPLPPAPHVISKIAEFSGILKGGGSVRDLIDPLSWLIHLFGDVHQPLHCVTRITSLHPRPDGDRGGNGFALKGNARNLHSLWDSSVSFKSESEQQVASDILQEHSREDLAADLKVTDVEKWARSSFSLAKQFAYGPLNENSASPPKPSAKYLANALKVGHRQAALAGYRLADRLHALLGEK